MTGGSVGVIDLHNEHSFNNTQNVKGEVFQGKPANPSTAVFEGHQTDEESGFRNAHEDTTAWEDHREETGHTAADWREKAKLPDGGAKTEDFWRNRDNHTVTDVKDDQKQGTSDTTKLDESSEATSAHFSEDHASSRKDESGTLAGTDWQKHQLSEHTDPGIFDLHEEYDSQGVAVGSFESFDEFAKAVKDWENGMDMIDAHSGAFQRETQQQHRDKRYDGLQDVSNSFVECVRHMTGVSALSGRNVTLCMKDTAWEEYAVFSGGVLLLFAVLLVTKLKRRPRHRGENHLASSRFGCYSESA